MHSRRTLLQALGFTTAGALVGAQPSKAGVNGAMGEPAPWWLVSPLQDGSSIDAEWSIEDLGPIQDGAAILTLKSKQESVRVHICLHDGKPKGIAYSELFDLIVMDRGHGVRKIPDNLAHALFTLSDFIRQNEWSDVPNHQLNGIHRMMTHAERVQSFGASHLQ